MGTGAPPSLLQPHTSALPSHQDVATMQFCANKLDKKDFFGKSDPFLVFYSCLLYTSDAADDPRVV